jgi:hypothetical protein
MTESARHLHIVPLLQPELAVVADPKLTLSQIAEREFVAAVFTEGDPDLMRDLREVRIQDPKSNTALRGRIMEAVPAGQSWPQLNLLSEQLITDTIRRRIGSTADAQTIRKELPHHVRCESTRVAARTIDWLGRLAVHVNDAQTARSSVMQLRNLGGWHNRRLARSLSKQISRADRYGHEGPVYGL